LSAILKRVKGDGHVIVLDQVLYFDKDGYFEVVSDPYGLPDKACGGMALARHTGNQRLVVDGRL